jgi:hypothetical protein
MGYFRAQLILVITNQNGRSRAIRYNRVWLYVSYYQEAFCLTFQANLSYFINLMKKMNIHTKLSRQKNELSPRFLPKAKKDQKKCKRKKEKTFKKR